MTQSNVESTGHFVFLSVLYVQDARTCDDDCWRVLLDVKHTCTFLYHSVLSGREDAAPVASCHS